MIDGNGYEGRRRDQDAFDDGVDSREDYVYDDPGYYDDEPPREPLDDAYVDSADAYDAEYPVVDDDPAAPLVDEDGVPVAHHAAEGEAAPARAAGKKSPVPLRALAMVLIAVGILLALWAVYALTSGDGDDAENAQDDPSVSGAAEPGAEGAAGAPGAPGAENRDGAADDAAPGDPRHGQPAPGDPRHPDAARADGAEGDDPRANDPGDRNADDPAGRDAAGAPAAADGVKRINVLNNSTVPDLAAQVSEPLRTPGTELGEVGNLPGEVLTVPENTVFFHAGNAEAETQARELAERLGGVAREFDPALPQGTTGDTDLTVVLATPVQL